VLASTQALLDSLPGDRRGPPPEPLRLKAGVLRFPARSSGSRCGDFGELASFVALPASALRRLAVVTGTPVRGPDNPGLPVRSPRGCIVDTIGA
jgi:peroxin-6